VHLSDGVLAGAGRVQRGDCDLDLTVVNDRVDPTFGFEVRTAGANPDAARYAGMRPRVLIVATMAICGALAGLAGTANVSIGALLAGLLVWIAAPLGLATAFFARREL